MKRLYPSSKTSYKEHLAKCLPIVLFSALSGLCSGILITLFSYVSEFLQHNSLSLYTLARENPAFIPLFILALLILAFLSYVIIKFIPEVKGSGVPRTEGVLRGLKPIVWWRTLVGTILGSFVSFFAGLSLGAEGPSVAIGSAIGSGVSKLNKGKKLTEGGKKEFDTLVTTAGSSSAFSSILFAPIAGLVFTLEELHQKFSPFILLASGSSITTSIIASTALRNLLGMSATILNVDPTPIPFEYTWALLLLGVVAGVLAFAFNKAICSIGEIKFLKKVPSLVKLMVVFLITGVVGLFVTEGLGGGMLLVADLTKVSFTWWALLIIFITKVALTILAFSSESPGGLLIPMLTIGALIGALMGKAFLAMGIPAEYYNAFIIITMSAFLGAVLRTPITAVVLLIEITGSLSGVLTIGVEVLIAFIVAELLMRKPFYDVLLERMVENESTIPEFNFKKNK